MNQSAIAICLRTDGAINQRLVGLQMMLWGISKFWHVQDNTILTSDCMYKKHSYGEKKNCYKTFFGPVSNGTCITPLGLPHGLLGNSPPWSPHLSGLCESAHRGGVSTRLRPKIINGFTDMHTTTDTKPEVFAFWIHCISFSSMVHHYYVTAILYSAQIN